MAVAAEHATVTVADDTSAVAAGRLCVRRGPRFDIDALMMDGVKEMDVIWHSAAEAAHAMQVGRTVVELWFLAPPPRGGGQKQ